MGNCLAATFAAPYSCCQEETKPEVAGSKRKSSLSTTSYTSEPLPPTTISPQPEYPKQDLLRPQTSVQREKKEVEVFFAYVSQAKKM